ncbi:MAG: hypothetical protein ACRD15_04945, partial [Vicinamibacterales bacterium]
TQDYTGFRPSRLWKRLPVERREAAAELFWNDEQSAEQQVEACALIATHMKFRAKSVLSLPRDKKTKYLVRLPNVSDAVAARALVNYHLERQRPLMGAFLDALGVAHEDGLIQDETVVKPESDKLRAAAADLGGKYPAEDVALYFSTLVSQDPETWGELAGLPQTG